jgi:hypothetical protein
MVLLNDKSIFIDAAFSADATLNIVGLESGVVSINASLRVRF